MKNPLREVYDKGYFGSREANLVRWALLVFVEPDETLKEHLLNMDAVSPDGPAAALTQLPADRFQAAVRELLEAKELVPFEKEGRTGYRLKGWGLFYEKMVTLGYNYYMREYRKKRRQEARKEGVAA